jgi:actin-related protein
VKDWFNNHTRDSSAGDGRKTLLDLSTKKQKMLPDWQAYSILYYESKVMAMANEQWPAEREKLLEKRANGENMKEPPEAAPLWFRNKLVRTVFQTETQEVKDEVENYRKSLSGAFVADEDEDEDEGDPEEKKRSAKAIAINKWVANSHTLLNHHLLYLYAFIQSASARPSDSHQSPSTASR